MFKTLALTTITALILTTNVSSAMAAPSLQLPFPCGQQWRLDTWGHAPALDMVKEPDQHGTEGATLVAPAAGTVNQSFYHNNAGNVIQINHGGGYFTTYLHLEHRAVAPGTRVEMGTVIGRVGKSGPTSNGHPHLHFELGYDADGSGSATWGYAGAERVRPTFNGTVYGTANNQTSRNVTSRNCQGSAEADDTTGEAVDFDGDGKPDLLGTTADGTLRVYRGTGSLGRPSVDAGTTIGSGWNSITRITVADIDNDGKNDLVGRGADGGLYAYLNKGDADFSGTRVTIGSGWEGITRVMVGDFNDDGKTDLLGQSTDGTLYAYLNTGTPGAPNISTRVLVGTGWDGIARVLVADADNDGKTDVIGQSADGILYAYLNTGAPNFANRVQIGTGWDGVSLVSTADIDGDGKTDVLARHGDGTLSAYLNKGTPGAPDISDRRQIGTGWNSVDRLTFADMDADGRTDVVGRFTDGTLNAYLAKGAADISTTFTIGSGWQGITRLAVVN
ncbi:Repeat domain-containing protein [Nonomuraea solani]|uniref:Repeat domain-containing protein n=1 Tax=Nonomuraea solani TaxID=1144553 RepID=A0A1H5Y4A5_9ACTN|nr:FG-GAP-like repeat-containing protein [Nonomuraea solani]SEG18821.1 Repeat domain-containing protein [Nonomuraea solani]